ncbi:Unknown protein sequence [Pseudomonas syringae pv. cilantro]|uniref:Uncharacterized protein n=1 Tax=Pseudomonas syringae pv. cilantro TaxID=81035 RepID=A0A0N0GE97_PSESX|nr:Unknown protein sequence [Pseudomonas syringae pv. cilantro]
MGRSGRKKARQYNPPDRPVCTITVIFCTGRLNASIACG